MAVDGDGQMERGWRLGCQARPWLQTWGREAFAATGFGGFETALDCLPLDDPRAFVEASARAGGLASWGAPAGGRWWAPDGGEAIPALVARVRRLPELGCRRLVVSGAPPPPDAGDEAIDRQAETLGELGRACREAAGVTVAFHNHAAELADDARAIRAIVERCPPEEVMLGGDLGWVAHAGTDVPAFIRRFGARLDHLHVRDVTTYGPSGGFLEVGRGALDHQAILAALAAAGYRGWLVAESGFTAEWRGATDPAETARLQFARRRAIGAAGGRVTNP